MKVAPSSLLVTADDSTGAMEAGAACADAGWTVDVVPRACSPGAPLGGNCVVIDLRSRHVAPDEARRRIMAATTDDQRVHKIDSTLRGNWSSELSALVEAGRRVVLIPSHPRVGRTCAGGVVFVHGVPVADSEMATDARLPVRSSRPGELLPGDEIADAVGLAAWLASEESGVAIVDATTIDDIDRLAAIALEADDVVLAGPASVVEAVAKACAPVGASVELPVPLLPDPVVVVCASLHPVSRAQIAGLAAMGIDVVTSSEVRTREPQDVAAEVAERAHVLVGLLQARSVILVGGDTAEAFLGDSVVRVFGSVGAGISLGEAEVRGRKLRLAGKPGGFGTPNTLVDLVTR